MTFRLGPLVVITPEETRPCEFCKEAAFCRPYGPDGKYICTKCAAKPEHIQEVQRRMAAAITGEKSQ